MGIIRYKQGYKYQLAEAVTFQTDIKGQAVALPFLRLYSDGRLTIMAGYAWDGPSGPTVDTKNSLRASLVHDAFYQLMRERRVPQGSREAVDKLFYEMLLEDGMWRFRAWVWYRKVRRYAGGAADPINLKPILEAP